MTIHHRQLKNNKKYFWLGISLVITLYYGLYFYYYVFSQQYIVQDDVRQHIVWLERFIDPELFPQDIISEYFYSLAPLGFKSLYIFAAKLGITPLLLAKLLPPVLAIVTTIYIYFFTLELLPIPLTGCLSSLLINQLMWLNDDLVSATHRAFIYPFFAAFLYYLAKSKLIPCLILMLLQGLFYPHILLIEMTILSLRLLTKQEKSKIRLTLKKQPYIWWIAGLIVSAIALYPITHKPIELATTVTARQMAQMPEFNLGGRNTFFGGGWFIYWFTGSSGLSLPLFPTIVWGGLLLPWLRSKKSLFTRQIKSQIQILWQVTIASLLMFGLAHLFLPQLHLPSRYTYHSLRFVLAITTGIVLTILWDLSKNWFNSKRQFKLLDKLKIALITLFTLTIIIFPAIPDVFTNWFQNWQIGTAPEIYQYLAKQPKEILVASLSEEANNIPAFAQRSILVGREFAMAYHPAYHHQIKQRTVDLLQAQYTTDLKVLQSFIQKYGVDYLLVDQNAFTSQYLLDQDWLINSSWSGETEKAIEHREAKLDSNFNNLGLSCLVVSTKKFDLLDTNCILNTR